MSAVICPRCLLEGDFDECPRCAEEGVRVTYGECVPGVVNHRRARRPAAPVGMAAIPPEKRVAMTLSEWWRSREREMPEPFETEDVSWGFG